jgi:ribosomal protein S18 acetylase RimI-like enzyme
MPHPAAPSDATAPRALQLRDLPGLLQVQLACYGEGFVESAEVFTRRLASPVNCSLVLERSGQVCAYLAAYRSVQGKVTPLHGDFDSAVAVPDTLYLHDMAVLPGCAGQGLAQALLAPLWAQGAAWGLRHTALVSVQGSQGYWERHGYAVAALEDPVQRERLASYGQGAVYMVRPLG